MEKIKDKTTKTGIIFGASSGVGAALTDILKDSYNLIGVSRRGLTPKGNSLKGVRCDAKNYESISNLIKDTPEDIDFVVSCIGIGFYSPLSGNYSSYWKDILETNIITNINILSNVKLHRPKCRQVIVIGSLASKRTSTTIGNEVYRASKVALETILYDFRSEMRVTGNKMKICNIVPGFIEDTDFSKRFFESNQSASQNLYSSFTNLTPNHVAKIIEWVLLSDPIVDICEIIVRPTEQPN